MLYVRKKFQAKEIKKSLKTLLWKQVFFPVWLDAAYATNKPGMAIYVLEWLQ